MELACLPCIIRHQIALNEARAQGVDPGQVPSPKIAITIANGTAVCWDCLPGLLSPAPPPGQTRSGLLVPTRG